jgi:hypothetical protein
MPTDSIEANSIAADKPAPEDRAARLRRIVAQNDLSYFRLLIEWVKLWPYQRITIDEYAALRLFDARLYAGVDKRAFIGVKGSRKILLRANYRLDFYALAGNKIACDFLLAAHGFPIMPTVALYRDNVGRQSPYLLRNVQELRLFLRDDTRYPLFGKPLGGSRSVGSASLEKYDREQDCVLAFGGRSISLEKFIGEIATNYGSGYLFQKRVSPDATVGAICGDRLATVRVLTALARGRPSVVRACWKIPAGQNAADNFWRSGNLLARIDVASGRVMRALRSTIHGFEEVTHHPDTGYYLVGAVVPNWSEIVRLASEAARVLPELPLLGWDIAPVDSGAIIVELNHIPDFNLHQIADSRGILDSTFIELLREIEIDAATWRRALRTGK